MTRVSGVMSPDVSAAVAVMVLVVMYVAIMAAKLSRIQRELDWTPRITSADVGCFSMSGLLTGGGVV